MRLWDKETRDGEDSTQYPNGLPAIKAAAIRYPGSLLDAVW